MEHRTDPLPPFEVSVKTLTGLCLSVVVNPHDTVHMLKHRLWQIQGIPIAQQQLLWQSRVLDDERTMQDCNIVSGSTIHLLVALRGGPLNSNRRLSSMLPWEDAELVLELLEGQDDYLSDFSDAMTPVEELVLDRIDYFTSDRSVLLMLQDSESGEISLFRICSDAELYTPVSEAADESPLRTASPQTADEPSRRCAGGTLTARLGSAVRRVENEQTREKMRQLRARMDTLRSVRHSLRTCPRSRTRENSLPRGESSRLELLTSRAHHDEARQSVLDQRTLGPTPMRASELEWSCAAPTPSPQAPKSSRADVGRRRLLPLRPPISDERRSNKSTTQKHRSVGVGTLNRSLPLSSWPNKSASRSNSVHEPEDLDHDQGVGGSADAPLTAALQRLALHEKSQPSGSEKHDTTSLKSSIQQNRTPCSVPAVTSLPPLRMTRNSQCAATPSGSKAALRRQRCAVCSKKLGLATTFTCRCGQVLCAQHRYSEVHSCSFDYKTSGREVLRHENPVVTALKLPKI